MTRRNALRFGCIAALAVVLAFGCSLVPRGNVAQGDGWYIKLRIQASAASKGITVSEFDVTGMKIKVLDPQGEVLKEFDWAPPGSQTYLVAVSQLGDYEIQVTHFGEHAGEQVQVTESAFFEIQAMKITVIDIVPGAIGAIQVEGGNGGGGVISGRVYDWVTGAGISGATVVFGNYSGTTDLSGAYSITVPDSVSSVDGAFAAFKGLEYSSPAAGGISVDPTKNPVYNIGLGPTDTSGYAGRNLSGRIYDNTGAELSDGTGLAFHFINGNGGQSYVTQDYLQGYSLNTKTFGSGCFVSLVARDQPNPFEAPLLQFYLQDQDLSTDRSYYDLTPDEDYTTVTVNGTDGTMFHGYLVAPNGGWVGVTGGEFSGSANTTLKLCNPDGFQTAWFTQTQETNTPAPGLVTVKSSAAMQPFSGTINLPAAYTHAAPSGAVDGTSVNWDPGTGTLSFDEVDGANGYVLALWDSDGHGSTMLSISSSITFPSKLVTDILEAGAGWDLAVWPLYSPQSTPETLVDLSLSLDPIGADVGGPMMEYQLAAIMTDVTKVDAIP